MQVMEAKLSMRESIDDFGESRNTEWVRATTEASSGRTGCWPAGSRQTNAQL